MKGRITAEDGLRLLAQHQTEPPEARALQLGGGEEKRIGAEKTVRVTYLAGTTETRTREELGPDNRITARETVTIQYGDEARIEEEMIREPTVTRRVNPTLAIQSLPETTGCSRAVLIPPRSWGNLLPRPQEIVDTPKRIEKLLAQGWRFAPNEWAGPIDLKRRY